MRFSRGITFVVLLLGAAWRVREDIFDAFRKLVLVPDLGQRRTDLTSQPLRSQTVGNYLIAYAPEEKLLLVVGVLHGRRSPRVIAAILRGRK